MNGESLNVAVRLLGHRRASTTNRYVHLDKANLSRSDERDMLVIGKLWRNASVSGRERIVPCERATV